MKTKMQLKINVLCDYGVLIQGDSSIKFYLLLK